MCSSVNSSSDGTSAFLPTASAMEDSAKIKGVSFVSTSAIAGSNQFRAAKDNSNCEWVSLMPFGFCDENGHEVKYNADFQWVGERSEGIAKYIDSARTCGLKIMLKPQVWFWNSFTGDFKCDSEKEWTEFEHSYLLFIMEFCKLAEEKQVEMFSIGTEWKTFVMQRPKFWNRLIDSVRTNYSGQLTYASNWDCYDKIPFWNKLDIIGIDAYFPLSDKPKASRKELKSRFNALNMELEQFASRENRRILFTEYGWRSASNWLKEPWSSDLTAETNLAIQKEIYEVFYETTWSRSWFAGGFVWKWFPDHERSGGKSNDRFTPQNKPAQEVIKAQYGT